MSATNGSGPRVGESRMRGERSRLSAPVRHALEYAARQQGNSLLDRFEATCKISARDTRALVDECDPLYRPVVRHLMDTYGDDDEDGQFLLDQLHAMAVAPEGSPELRFVTELFRFMACVGTGAAMEGWLAGAIYTFEKRESLKRAAQRRPGR